MLRITRSSLIRDEPCKVQKAAHPLVISVISAAGEQGFDTEEGLSHPRPVNLPCTFGFS
jgi:hypothetical protein